MNYTSKPVVVRYAETDQMQFVHHSNYLKYFEMARLEWLSSLGVSYASMEKEGILMPVVSAETKFKKPLFFGDEFKVKVRLKKPPMATLEFEYQIVNQLDEEVCLGETVLAFLSAQKNRPIRCPEFLLKMFT
ncbi:acyl-CoA thioesterase [Flavobacteriaceae bacterium]|nr:acyl-CoA thioesterase [Flavobacteriaceae bacterium]MDA9015259.1 acyl-CoA thioesterase [Flavobacteriaceae bacterium]MDA9571894.1 acyl-CoA thioesterase [Flavobacteriaceae bacterium]